MYNKVEICGVNTADLKVLTEKQKTELLRRVRDGDKAAREEMVNGNLRLVLSVVQRFTGRGENLDDLFQVGCIGLVKSIDNFDISQNVRFSTYAVPMIHICRTNPKGEFDMTRKAALQKAICILSEARGNEEIIEKLNDIQKELPIIHWSDKSIRDRVDQFIEDNGRVPTVSDFAKPGMPPHPVILQKYKITLKNWLIKNYPDAYPSTEVVQQKAIEVFIENYMRIKPKSSAQFNANRDKNCRGWMTIARYLHVAGWRTLINKLGLPHYLDKERDHVPMQFVSIVHTDIDFDEV